MSAIAPLNIINKERPPNPQNKTCGLFHVVSAGSDEQDTQMSYNMIFLRALGV